MKRTKEKVRDTIESYLKRKEIYYDDAPWTIRESPHGGFGVFAKRDIKPGEFIFHDLPVIIGPRFLPNIPDMCVSCFSNVNLEKCRNCPLSLCSGGCKFRKNHESECNLLQNLKLSKSVPNGSHPLNTLSCLTPLRALLLNEEDQEVVRILKAHRGSQHGKEIEFLITHMGMEIKESEKNFLVFVCSVLDANAFEVVVGNEDKQTSLKGLYPLGSLANHRCYPNTTHVFDSKQRMVVRAATAIKNDEEIFHSYTRIIWGTTSRIFHLKNTKHFICKCKRCLDPTEFGAYMNAIICKMCKGNAVPLDPFKSTQWKCEVCGSLVSSKEVGYVLSLMGSILKGLSDADFRIIYRFLSEKLINFVPESHETCVELKYKVVWILGHSPGYTWKELGDDLINLKIKYCNDILTLLQKLDTGQCKMRGLLLYELYQCSEEIKRRKNGVICENSGNYFKEAADILRDDVSAPKEIKELGSLRNLQG